MKKIFATVIVSLIAVLCVSLSVQAVDFPDVVGTKYNTAVQKLVGLGVINGFDDGTFKPEDPVTRCQLAKMLVEELKLKNVTNIPLVKYSDVTTTHWAYNWIKTSDDNSLILGYTDGTFRPDNTVTYAEAETMILRALKLEDKMTDKTWPTGYINEAAKQGLLVDVEYPSANAPATRGNVAISLYHMTSILEARAKQAEADKKAAEQEAVKEAEKNAMDFGIVSTTSYTKETYTLRFIGDKDKYEIYSISGKTKLTETKTEELNDNVIGYKDSKKGLEVIVCYKPADFDKAKIITKANGDIITFKDKTTWDLASDSLASKYRYYTFVRVEASYDGKKSNPLLEFDSVKKLGLGLNSASLSKEDRLLIDDTNQVILILRGLDVEDVIKKGKITEGSEDTSDYEYGWVTGTSYKNKTDYVEINNKTTYEVSTKSDDFNEDTFVVFTNSGKGDDYDIVKLVKSYSYSTLDSGAKIVTSVSGKTGAQKIKYSGSSTEVNYYSDSNKKKYEDYHFVYVELSLKDKNIRFKDADWKVDLEDISFEEGDRVVIDDSKEVFIVYNGLDEDDNFKSGKLYTPTNTPTPTKKPTSTPATTVVPTTAPTTTPTPVPTTKPTTQPTPTKVVVTPTKVVVTPTKAAVTPTKAAVTPTKAAVTPTKVAVTPTKVAVTPTPEPHKHELIRTAPKAATCEEGGNNEYYTCSGCKKVFKDSAATKETTVKAETINALGHDWTVAVLKEPTCTEAGSKQQTCKRCSKKGETTSIKALGHSWGEWKVTKKPTKEEEGEQVRECERDGCSAKETKAIPKLDS